MYFVEFDFESKTVTSEEPYALCDPDESMATVYG